ncbi:MAG TPA: class I SAM-dependent methyltransferase [Candidatus Eisenbacteria bacterium]
MSGAQTPRAAGRRRGTAATRLPDTAVDPAYSRLAPHYDRVFGSYARELNRWLVPWVKRLDPRPRSALDLACGTGTTALALARVMPRCLAIDLRPEFAAIVSARAGKAASTRHLEARTGDMRTFRLAQRVDLVTCFFDAINHLPRPTDIDRTFKSVHRALAPGGLFLFDINTPWALKKTWPEMKAIWKGRGWFAVARGRYVKAREPRGPENNGSKRGHPRGARGHGEFDIHWFMRDTDGAYAPRVERFREIAWTAAEVRAALKKAGFAEIRTLNEPGLAPFVGETGKDRTFWVARREDA